MADVALHRFLAQEQPFPDLAVGKPVGDELEHLVLARRRLLAPVLIRLGERDDVGHGRVPPRRDRVEARGMLRVPGQDGIALSSVHA